jgi:hypothetical protein
VLPRPGRPLAPLPWPQGIWAKKPAATKSKAPAGGRGADEDDDGDEAGEEGGGGAAAGEDSDEEGGELDKERLKMYERSKLRWYYAVRGLGAWGLGLGAWGLGLGAWGLGLGAWGLGLGP